MERVRIAIVALIMLLIYIRIPAYCATIRLLVQQPLTLRLLVMPHLDEYTQALIVIPGTIIVLAEVIIYVAQMRVMTHGRVATTIDVYERWTDDKALIDVITE
jgi:hypothetical protein